MKRVFVSLLLLCSGCFFCSLAAADESRKGAPTIAAILPLSGKGASLGGYIRKGIELAYSQAGEKGKKVKLVFEDDAWDVKNSISALRKLSSDHNLVAVFGVGSAVGNALAPIAEQKKIPLIAIGASDFNIVKGRKYAFTHWVTPETEAKKMVDEILKRKYQKVGIIGAEHAGIIAVLNALEGELQRRDAKNLVVLEETFLADQTDFRTFVAKAKDKKLDGVAVCLLPGGISSFAKQIARSGMKTDLMGIELFEDESEVAAAEGGLDGHWYVNADVATDEFENAYRERFSEQPGWATANAFDALTLVIDAVSKSKDVQAYLSGLVDHDGAAGRYSASGDNRFTLPATIKEVTSDGFKKVE